MKVAEQTAELHNRELELRGVVDTIPAIVWIALPDGSNTYINSRFVEYSGMSTAQAAGSGWRAAIHPEDLETNDRKWLAAVASGEPLETEVHFRRADGRIVPTWLRQMLDVPRLLEEITGVRAAAHTAWR